MEILRFFRPEDTFALQMGFFFALFLFIAFFHFLQFSLVKEKIDFSLGCLGSLMLIRILLIYQSRGGLSFFEPIQTYFIRTSFFVDVLIILAGYLFVSEFSKSFRNVQLKESQHALFPLGFLALLAAFVPKEYLEFLQIFIFLSGALVVSRLIFVTVMLSRKVQLHWLVTVSLYSVSFLLLVFSFLDAYSIIISRKALHLTEYGFAIYWIPWFIFYRKKKTKFYLTSHTSKLEIESKLDELITAFNSERKKAEKASEIKDKIISIVSHDIRSPMSGISSVLQLLADDSKGVSPGEFKSILSNSAHSMRNLMKMMEDLIQYSRFQNASILPSYQLFDYGDLIQSAKRKIEKQYMDKFQVLSWDSRENCIAMGDPGLLEKLLLQLLSNACKFSPKGSQIQISLFEKDSHWLLAVTDPGIGFPAEWSSQIFEQGFQFLRKGTSDEMGPGVGLLFCKEIADMHGATLTATSSDGKGATFEFALPNHSQSIFLLDDNAIFRKRLRKELNQFPFVIWEGEAPEKANTALEILKPDLIITDYQMPEMNGIEFVKQVLVHSDLVDVPIAMITSEVETEPAFLEIQREAKKLGIDAFYNKEKFIQDLPLILKDLLKLNE